MMKFLIPFLLLTTSVSFGLKLEHLASTTLPFEMKFQNTKVGGLSGLWLDSSTQNLWAVCDDRGKIGEPRLYEFSVSLKASELKVEPKSVVFVKLKDSKDQVLDLEGITVLPWGNFLLSSEGDNNHKPRAWPMLMDVKRDGSFVRSYEIPEDFLPEKTGQQKKGIRNNNGFEGLTSWPEKNLIWAWTEGPLLQDPEAGSLRVLQYEMPEAWLIKPTQEFRYQPEAPRSVGDKAYLQAQVSEALALSDHEFLVLERSLTIGPKGAGFGIQIFKTDLQDLDAKKVMKKTLVLDFDTISDKIGELDNFEGLSFGPLVDGQRTLIAVSDDNFRKVQKTQFVIFKILEEGKKK